MTRTASQVVAWAQAHANGSWHGMCLSFVRQSFGAPGGQYDAKQAWYQAKYRHTTGTPPRGAAVFWLGGSAGHGHIALSLGGGHVLSTDIRRSGKADNVPLTEIHDKWGLRYVGWSEDVNGVRIPGLATGGKWYHVDPHKVSSSLNGRDSSWKVRVQRPRNYNLNIVSTLSHDGRQWGVASDGIRYAMDYLAPGKV
jgi:hypothetical protein